MTSAAPLGDKNTLEELFDELGRELAEVGATAEIVMVGGSRLLWHTKRAATHDVDSARRFDETLTAAAARVATRHDLDEGWLNDNAARSGRPTPTTQTAPSLRKRAASP